jgi:hypothetical protein
LFFADLGRPHKVDNCLREFRSFVLLEEVAHLADDHMRPPLRTLHRMLKGLWNR